MNIIFDLSHPAHFHLFKNFIKYLNQTGHQVTITTRNKDITNILLEKSGFKYTTISEPGRGKIGLVSELITRDIKLLRLHRKNKFDLGFGTSPSLSHLSCISHFKSYIFNEDDDAVVPLFTYSAYPFATRIINPDSIIHNKWKKKRIYHQSYHELAYLHPDHFIPDIKITEKYGLNPDKYIIIRHSSLKAHHDTHAKGINNTLFEEIYQLLKDFTIIDSYEEGGEHKIDPIDMHHILAFAKMIISDSQTMTIEGAVLGIPAIRINTFIGKSSVIKELESKYKLAYGFFPNQENEILGTLKNIIEDQDIHNKWSERRAKLLSEKEDLAKWMINYFEGISK